MHKLKKIILDPAKNMAISDGASKGLRVILAPQDGLAVTVLVMVEAGRNYETKEINGLSHFLEHMCFKGTTKRPGNLAIATELDEIGAQFNAFTGEEFTGYFAKAEARHLSKIMEVVSDLYLNPTFPKEDIEKERGVIMGEMHMYEDIPMRKVAELFEELLYGDQPAGWDIIGREEVIKKLEREDFIKYRDKHYVAPATTVVVSGNFSEEEAVSSIKERFADIALGEGGVKAEVREEQTEPKIIVKNKKSDQTHMILGVRAFDLFDERRYALEVLATILGRGMSSRLFKRVREELGAGYYARASADLFTNYGYVAAAIGVNHEKLEEVIKVVLEEFKDLTKNEVSEQELKRGQEMLIGKLVSEVETSDDLAVFYGLQETLEKEIMEPDAIIEKIRQVGATEIKKVAQDLFKEECLNLALIGPYEKKDEDNLEKLLQL